MKCGEARLIMVAFVSIRRNPTPNVLFSRFDTLARSGTVGLGYELFRFQGGKNPRGPHGRGSSSLLIFLKLGKRVPED